MEILGLGFAGSEFRPWLFMLSPQQTSDGKDIRQGFLGLGLAGVDLEFRVIIYLRTAFLICAEV